MTTTLTTERLTLRQWREADKPAFAAMGADSDVMRYFPALMSRQESDDYAGICQSLIAQRGWGFWAVERRDSSEFIGFVGLHIPGVALPFAPCVEIGWRLAPRHWRQGFATEAARASLHHGFEVLQLKEIVSFTAQINAPSQAVMRKLGMRQDAVLFDHPSVPEGHALQSHCLYRLSHDAWARSV